MYQLAELDDQDIGSAPSIISGSRRQLVLGGGDPDGVGFADFQGAKA
jgi:hypothetical protein